MAHGRRPTRIRRTSFADDDRPAEEQVNSNHPPPAHFLLYPPNTWHVASVLVLGVAGVEVEESGNMTELQATTQMVKELLNREQMLHGFDTMGNGLTPEIEAMDDDTLAEEVAKNILGIVQNKQ